MSLEPLDKMEKVKGRSPLPLILVFLVVVVLIAGAAVKLYERGKPQISIVGEITRFGSSAEMSVSLHDDKSGIRKVDVTLIQEGKSVQLFSKSFQREGIIFPSGPKKVEETFAVHAGELGLKDGAAEVSVTVRDFSWSDWMKGNRVTMTFPVVLDTRPPVIRVVDSPQYIKTGSAGVVVYKINEPVENHGVLINGFFHRGFPLPQKGEGTYGACIGLPYDADKIEQAVVEATDKAGNTGKSPFGMIVRKVRYKHDRIDISDGFLNMKLPEFAAYYPDLPGTPVEQYLYVNGTIRRENYQRVREACRSSAPERLWKGRFKRMPRSSRRAGFADYRTYYYHGREIDKQVHLGVDLASVRHADVPAANNGIVVFAEYLGIYGNTVILDHGQGVFSLYSHLSQINVAKGDELQKGDTLGLTGMSGMAGGDHLHFSMLINGIFVNPVEWWDLNWLELNILNYL